MEEGESEGERKDGKEKDGRELCSCVLPCLNGHNKLCSAQSDQHLLKDYYRPDGPTLPTSAGFLVSLAMTFHTHRLCPPDRKRIQLVVILKLLY